MRLLFGLFVKRYKAINKMCRCFSFLIVVVNVDQNSFLVSVVRAKSMLERDFAWWLLNLFGSQTVLFV